ncbi:MAG: PQQ-dependent sugar dehydrogenase [Planctomycetota bacterium]|jgi:glucose/arabinose dehydrogenase
MNVRTGILAWAATLLPGIVCLAELPEGYQAVEVVSGLDEPIAVACAGDGRMFVATRPGQVFVVVNDELISDPILSLDVHTHSESGLLGIAVDPRFESNSFIYLFATVSTDEQKIYRATVVGNQATDLITVRGDLPTNGFIHNGGCLRMGPDEKLYFAIGDNGDPANGQNLNTLAGKINRINLDGTIPEDNPYKTPTGTTRSLYAIGFRNPFRFHIASDGRIFAGDIGSDNEPRREEINLVDAGANHGWPEVEGYAEDDVDSAIVDPLLSYYEEGSAITGIVFYESTHLPDEFHENLFHIDYIANAVFRVQLDGENVVSHEKFFETGQGPVDLVIDHLGRIVFVEFFSGTIKRVENVRNPAMQAESESDTNGTGVSPDSALPICGAAALPSVSFLLFLLCPARRFRYRTN